MWSRQVRWARLRRVTFPLFFAPEIASGRAAACLAVALYAGTTEAGLALAVMVALTYAGEYALAVRAGGCAFAEARRRLRRARPAHPLRLGPGLATGGVVWRGNAMAIENKPAASGRVAQTIPPAPTGN